MNFKSVLRMSAMAFCTVALFSLASCSDDDDEIATGSGDSVKPENVFQNGLPKSVGGAQITSDAKGQVTEIKEGSETITFQYGNFTPARAHNFTVLMKIHDADYPGDDSDIYIEVNTQGFATYAYQVYKDNDYDSEEWWFGYNSDGQLNYLRRSEDGDSYNATYVNGDITKVEHIEGDGDHREYTFAYTNETETSAIANKGSIMLFDGEFRIDMDEMGIAYYAGLLGKATKSLPIGYTEKSVEGGSSYTDSYSLNWEFNANGLPVKFWEGENTYDTVTFNW